MSNKLRVIIVLALVSLISVLLVHRISPLILNPGIYDADVMWGGAKGLLEGKVPFRDSFDIRGPSVYLVGAFGILLSGNSLISQYFITSGFILLGNLFLYKYLRLTNNWKVSLIKSALIGTAIILSLNTISNYYFELWFYPVFTGLVYLIYRPTPNTGMSIAPNIRTGVGTDIGTSAKTTPSTGPNVGMSVGPSVGVSLVIGIVLGLIFWAKYPIVIQFVVIAIAGIVINRKTYLLQVIKDYLLIVIGALIPSAIVVVYYAMNNYLFEMLSQYFNLSGHSIDLPTLTHNFLYISLRLLIYAVLLIPLLLQKFSDKAIWLTCFFISIVIATLGYSSENVYIDYLAFIPHFYFIFGLVNLQSFKYWKIVTTIIACFLISFNIYYNLFQVETKITLTTEFAPIPGTIPEPMLGAEQGTTSGETTFVYCGGSCPYTFDIYRKLNTSPPLKYYFISNNWSPEKTTEATSAQTHFVETAKPPIVYTKKGLPLPNSNSNYTFVGEYAGAYNIYKRDRLQ
jgi:hypothetical protein